MQIKPVYPTEQKKDRPRQTPQEKAFVAIKKRNEQEPVNAVIQGRVDTYA